MLEYNELDLDQAIAKVVESLSVQIDGLIAIAEDGCGRKIDTSVIKELKKPFYQQKISSTMLKRFRKFIFTYAVKANLSNLYYDNVVRDIAALPEPIVKQIFANELLSALRDFITHMLIMASQKSGFFHAYGISTQVLNAVQVLCRRFGVQPVCDWQLSTDTKESLKEQMYKFKEQVFSGQTKEYYGKMLKIVFPQEAKASENKDKPAETVFFKHDELVIEEDQASTEAKNNVDSDYTL